MEGGKGCEFDDYWYLKAMIEISFPYYSFINLSVACPLTHLIIHHLSYQYWGQSGISASLARHTSLPARKYKRTNTYKRRSRGTRARRGGEGPRAGA